MSAEIFNLRDVVQPDASFLEPLIAVVDAEGTLGDWVRTLCSMLRVEVTIAPDAAALSCAIEARPPLGIVCGEIGDDGPGIASLLKLISCYDHRIPVLLVTRDDPETLGRVDAAIQLWPLSRIERYAGQVRIEAILDFIARAGRERGTMRLLPV